MRVASRLVFPYLGTFMALAVCTGMIAIIRLLANVGNISTVYLLAVLASAVAFGSRAAVAAAIGSFLAYNFFFIQPQFSFTVANGDEWIALVLLLVTGVITAQLAAALRQRAIESTRREREAVVLYDIVTLMTERELQRALTLVAERLRAELSLDAVVIAFGKNASAAQANAGDTEAIRLAQEEAADMILGRGRAATTTERGTPGRWIRIVQPSARPEASRSGQRRVRSVGIHLHEERMGTIVIVRKTGASEFSIIDDRLMSAIARQVSVALERLLLQRDATEAEILRRTDELRSALLNAVSHDLRTPLSSIIASAGSLRQKDVPWTEQEREEFAAAIEDEAQRLNHMVGNLLDLSRIEAGQLRPEKGWYDIRSLIREVAGRLRFMAASHRLVTDVGELPPLEFDYVEIDQVVSNLLENAILHTPVGTEIRVAARLKGDVVEVEVADRGRGIPKESLPHLFDAFYRVPEAGATAQGSGLGLAVARGLVAAHGGSICAENRPQGGARFVFTLPITERVPDLEDSEVVS